MRRWTTWSLAAVLTVGVVTPAMAIPEGPEDGSQGWYQREGENYARTRDEANREFSSPEFQQRLTEQSAANEVAYLQFQAANQFNNVGNLCARWEETCAGDPFRYPGVDPFYDEVGGFTEVLFHDRGCARISARVWAPLGAQAGDDLPGVVITTGSVQAPEPLYWWAAQALVEAGYVVMTWDVRGQGRSDTQTPTGEQGGNSNPAVFWDGTVDAVDFFHATPENPYPHNATCAASAPLPNGTDHNPHHDLLDRGRLGLAGHSLGATGVSTVQGYETWPGEIAGPDNPVDVIVAWDSLSANGLTPRVPAMGQSSEYGLFNVPFGSSPDPEGHTNAFNAWVKAGLPTAQFTIQGSTHYEWSQIPSRPVYNFSSTRWDNWGNPMAAHHTVAWFDRWLKTADEKGHADADARLLDDATYCERFSFYYRSARNFVGRDGTPHVEGDIRASCLAAPDAPPSPAPTQPAPVEPGPEPEPEPLPATGGGLVLIGLLATAAARRLRGA